VFFVQTPRATTRLRGGDADADFDRCSTVQALRAAIDADADPSPLLDFLETNIARLRREELRRMLRVAAG
jgi:hypothetical protein